MWEAELQLSKGHETGPTTPVSSQLDTPQDSEITGLESGRVVEVLWSRRNSLRNDDRKGTQRITGNIPVLSGQSNFECTFHKLI